MSLSSGTGLPPSGTPPPGFPGLPPGVPPPGANGGPPPGVGPFPSGPLPPMSETVLVRVIASTSVLYALALATFFTRIYLRFGTFGGLGSDDYAITGAFIFATVMFTLNCVEYSVNHGLHTVYLNPDQIMASGKFNFMSQLVWIWGITLTKASVLLMLLRIKHTPKWKYSIWILGFFAIGTAIVTTVINIISCRPIEANWDMTIPRTACWDPNKTLSMTYTASTLLIISDVICALLPVLFIRKINRPLRERIVLIVLMALGLVASGCGIASRIVLGKIFSSRDPAFAGSTLTILAMAELFIGITTACIPCLKALMERAFKFLGGHITSLGSSQSSNPKYGYRSSKYDWPSQNSSGRRGPGGQYGFSEIDERYPDDGTIPLNSVTAERNHNPRSSKIKNGAVLKEVEISWSRDRV
ncbi:hypothetical protein BT63DRAFT_196820 [Microthyrium microscopicum]|uniref:Rhodopsin domain-containing protein n=1 Tax=Microthyrium microscopicum TaxID=703497 RepID=A0A6A6UM01_9PEZI|nr:hypothetical protein BT63DRAFT_196820 [Microthyrium microscopicum]